MNTHHILLSILIASVGLSRAAENPAAATNQPANSINADTNAAAADVNANGNSNANSSPNATASSTNNPATDSKATNNSERNLRLNFRGAPLEMVLNYLSDAAGFIILPGQVDVKGKVDVWSNQPLNKDEAVQLLNTILNQNGYTAIQKGRTLQIVKTSEARTQDLPVHSGNEPKDIPKTDQMVTQVIPVRYINAGQIVKDLEPLMADFAKLTANESGNALILTDTQSHIRRMVEIIRALDNFPGVTSIKVFPLQYADAKELATAIKDLFTPPQTGNQNGRGQFFRGGFPGFGRGDQGGQGGGNAGGSTGGPTQNSKVTAVADERTNSLVVSAPEDVMPSIENLVRDIDVNAVDVTELRVFHLLNADPVEVADIFSTLFPDDSRNDQQNQGGFRFFGGRFGGNRNPANNNSDSRSTKKGKVVAVADQRTSSVIISAASELMPEIAGIINQLDSNSTKKQKVYIYSLENADVQQVEQVVRDMFERNNVQANRNTQNDTSQLQNRIRQQQQNQNTGQNRNSAFGNGAFGNSNR
jgi:general secretion pathway protein D